MTGPEKALIAVETHLWGAHTSMSLSIPKLIGVMQRPRGGRQFGDERVGRKNRDAVENLDEVVNVRLPNE